MTDAMLIMLVLVFKLIVYKGFEIGRIFHYKSVVFLAINAMIILLLFFVARLMYYPCLIFLATLGIPDFLLGPLLIVALGVILIIGDVLSISAIESEGSSSGMKEIIGVNLLTFLFMYLLMVVLGVFQ